MPADLFGIVGSTVVGAFHVEAAVAEGGFAVVYRAYHEGFRAPVALKCLKIPRHFRPAERERFTRQFRAEAEVLFKLSASIPTVVRPLHVEAVIAPSGAFMPFLALEWLDGETLEAVAQGRRSAGHPFTLTELVEVMTPVARALARAHALPTDSGKIVVVHRDLKPENIFLARVAGETVVKILDFGISAVRKLAAADSERASTTAESAESFTPAYAAPEQWSSERFGETGPWTDVWGLALTMVEILAGRPILDGTPEEIRELATRVDGPRTPRAVGLSVSDAVENVFRAALAVSPRDRHRDAGQFWDALLSALRAPAEESSPAVSRSSVSSIPEFDAPDEAGVAIELDLGEEGGLVPERASVRISGVRAAASVPPASRAASLPPVVRSLPPGPVQVQPDVQHPAAGADGVAPAVTVPEKERAPPTLVRVIALPLALLAAGVVLTMLDGAYASSTGDAFTLGPLRLGWVAAATAVAGLSLGVYRFVLHSHR